MTKAYGKVEVKRTMNVGVDLNCALWNHEDSFEVDGELSHKESHKFAIISPPELKYMLEEVGFIRVETYNNWLSKEPEVLNEARIVIAAQKSPDAS